MSRRQTPRWDYDRIGLLVSWLVILLVVLYLVGQIVRVAL